MFVKDLKKSRSAKKKKQKIRTKAIHVATTASLLQAAKKHIKAMLQHLVQQASEKYCKNFMCLVTCCCCKQLLAVVAPHNKFAVYCCTANNNNGPQ